MNFQVISVKDKSIWEAGISQWPQTNFLQSWNWGEFHKNLGKNVWYFQIMNGEKIVGCALVVAETAKRGNYLTIAGGPLIDWTSPTAKLILRTLISKLRIIANKEQSVFLRVRLQEKDSSNICDVLRKNGFLSSPMHLTADLTLQLNLQKSEDELLRAMRKNTRYEIRKAEKLGITVKLSNDRTKIKKFYQYQLQVANRHNFIPFSYDFLQKQFNAFLSDDQVLLIHAYAQKKLLASAFVIFYRDEAVYHYGVSTNDNAKLPGSYACQWEAIREAKRRGIKRYNFWGIAPENQPNHRFAGVSVFKRGFGGEEVAYVPAHDLPFSRWYWITWLFEFSRKKIRKL